MNRVALAPLALLPLLALQEPALEVEWLDLGAANTLARETGKPLLIVFR